MNISKKSGKIFWGIFFLLAAVYVIVSQLGILPKVSVFTVIFTVFCIWLLVNGIRNISFWQILFSIAIVCILYAEPLGITALTPWSVLGAAALGSIGLSMIFPKKKKRIWKHANINVGGSSTGEYNGERVECENSFGESIKYINSENFCYANLDNSFGSLTVYFDNAMIPSGKATVNVDNSFGEVSLYVPKIWKVQVRMDHSFGSVEEKGRCEGSSDTTLDIVGDTSFGTVNVYYI